MNLNTYLGIAEEAAIVLGSSNVIYTSMSEFPGCRSNWWSTYRQHQRASCPATRAVSAARPLSSAAASAGSIDAEASASARCTSAAGCAARFSAQPAALALQPAQTASAESSTTPPKRLTHKDAISSVCEAKQFCTSLCDENGLLTCHGTSAVKKRVREAGAPTRRARPA